MAGRFVSNNEYGAANLVALVLQYREKHGEIDGRLLALAEAIDNKIATLRNELLGGAGASYDTFKELQDLFLENKDLLDELKAIAGKHVRFDIAQSLTNAEKALARSNIGAVTQSEVDSWIDAAIPNAPTASVSKTGNTATITIKDASGTTTASISDGSTGPFYTPVLDEDGNISWTNNGGLANPSSRNIRGPQGDKGDTFTFDDLTPEQVESLRGREGQQGPVGPQGYTFTPSVSSTGVLTWTNNGGLANPSAVNIKGPEGQQGPQGKPFTYDDFTQSQLDALRGPEGQQGQQGQDGKNGVTFTPSLSSSGVLTWTNDGGLANPNAVSLEGPQGIPGKDGATFTPSVTEDGDLSWTNNQGLTNPATVNIRGPQGPQGDPGKDGVSPDLTLYLSKTEAQSLYLGKSDNAVSATKATQDGNGNDIAQTYATKSSLNTVSSTATSAQSTANSALSSANAAVKKVNGVAPGTDGNVTVDVTLTKDKVTSALGYTPLQTAPVTSVDGKTGAVSLSGVYQPKGNYLTSAPVTSVMGKTGAVTGLVTSVNGVSPNSSGAVSLFSAGTSDLTAGSSSLATNTLYFVYE